MNIRKFAVVFSLLAVLIAGTVLSAAAATPMHVSGFKATYALGQTKASLRVLDALNRPVSAANVQVSFEKEGAPIVLRSHLTGALGWTSIAASLPAGKWMVCIEEIHKIGFNYNPAVNQCTTISVP
jgi:hypothetical protein